MNKVGTAEPLLFLQKGRGGGVVVVGGGVASRAVNLCVANRQCNYAARAEAANWIAGDGCVCEGD